MKTRNLFLLGMLLGLLPTLVLGAPAAPAAASAPDELAGDTADINAPAAPAVSAPSAPSPKDGAAVPVAGPIAPEQYFQLLLERQRLSIDYYREVQKALDAHAKDQKAAMKALAALEAERRKRSLAMFEKYGITEDQYLSPPVGPEVQTQRSQYLDAHPEVRDQISSNSKELKALENKAQDRIAQIVGRPAAEPPRRPKK